MSKVVSAPLFDVTNVDSVRSNPILAKAFVRLVPPYELARIAREADFENSLLDEPAIVDGILDSGNPDLALVLATYGASSIFRRLTADRLMQLIDISPAHKAAVFANPRINWYGPGLFGDTTSFATKELVEGMQQTERGEQPSEFARLLAANPRFDRGAIAEVMRAQPPYADVPIGRRVFVAFHALGATEIPSPDYPGKNSPDRNELDFEKPLAALPTLVRDVYRAMGRDGFLAFADQFVWKLRTLNLDVEADDWLAPDDSETKWVCAPRCAVKPPAVRSGHRVPADVLSSGHPACGTR